ncbi:Oxidoreductase swnN [Paramyrothecium foliicola]|nr:Oxidoreductase swnN [Paramyrothecium foliicola]
MDALIPQQRQPILYRVINAASARCYHFLALNASCCGANADPFVTGALRSGYPLWALLTEKRAMRVSCRLTFQSESKIDHLTVKLDNLLLAIDNLESSLGHADANVPTSGTADHTPLSLPGSNLVHKTPVEDQSGSELQRDAVLATQAAFAAKFAQQAVDGSHLLHVSPDVRTCLEALKDELREKRSGHDNPKLSEASILSPNASQYNFTLPPIHIAMAAIQKLKDKFPFCWCMEIDVAQFVDYFFTVYSGTPSLADLIIVHCGLYNLLVPYGNLQKDEALQKEINSQSLLCQQNLESILANLPLNVPSTYDFVLALLMATTYFVQRCSMSRAWSYLAAAAQICLTLGYHRDTLSKLEKKQERQRRARLFWLVYVMDKLLALRLNRPPLLRDRDITVSCETCCETAVESSLPLAPKWVKMGALYGKIYDEIFSPGALLQPLTARESRARELAVELQCLFDSEDAVEESFLEILRENPDDLLPKLVGRADRISHLAIITLVYRSIQPSSSTGSAFSDECLSSAKECLEEHKEVFSLLQDVESSIVELYVQWALLAAPFVPFIVLFCHTIETRDPNHLENLSAVVQALQILPRGASDVYGKQRRVFELMYNVASNTIHLKSNNMGIIAVAGGTGGLGKTVIEQLRKHGPHHQVFILGRKAPSDHPPESPQFLQVDYDDVDSLSRVLQDHNIDTVISTINLETDAGSQSQINLITSAEQSQPTRRFIPSEFVNVIDEDQPDSGLGMGGWIPNARVLKKTNLEYIRISIGFFSDYFGMPHIKSNLKPFKFFLDFTSKKAAVPGTGDDKFTLTYSEDLARFIVRLLDDNNRWPERGLISGSDVSVNELITTAERVTGTKFDIVYDTVEQLDKGEVTVLFHPEEASEAEFKPMLAGLCKMIIAGDCLLPNDERRLDGRYPEIPITSTKEILNKAWKGRF